MVRYTKAEIAQFKDLFDSIDTDNSGGISKKEFEIFLKQINFEPHYLELLFFAYDQDKNDILEFSEFLIFLTDIDSVSAKGENVFYKRVFQAVDTDNDEHVTSFEIQRFSEVIKNKKSLKEIEAALNKFGVKTMAYEQFVLFFGFQTTI